MLKKHAAPPLCGAADSVSQLIDDGSARRSELGVREHQPVNTAEEADDAAQQHDPAGQA